MSFSRKIHFIWIGDPMPDWAAANIDEFRRLNPDHEITIHGEEALLDDYRSIYDRLEELASKADLLRYSILEREGGWYFDTDTWPLRPVCDIEHAYRPDGRRMIVGEQYERKHRLWINNGAIGVSTDWPGWPAFKRMLMATEPKDRVAFGPALLTRFVREHRDLVDIVARPWFYGIRPEWSGKLYRQVRRGRMTACRTVAETGGQFPFSMHLWAGNKHVNLSEHPPIGDNVFGEGERTALVACTSRSVPSETTDLWSGVVRGLVAAGFRVERHSTEKAFEASAEIPDVLVTWNGMRAAGEKLVQIARMFDIPVIRIEHGFYERKLYSQADHEGILHWASWRRELLDPAPAEGQQRLARFYPDGIRPMKKRKGYILVIGQVMGDSQMLDSPIQSAIPLQRLVHRATKDMSVPVYFRPHPSERSPRQILLKSLPGGDDARGVYVKTKHGLGLAEALDGAAFIITINSNTIVETLAAGVPALAFGPHLGIDAGVVRQTCEGTLRTDILDMLAGWRPDQAAVQNFLEHLACRQWTPDEFADPVTMAKLLDAAGVSHGRSVENRCCVA